MDQEDDARAQRSPAALTTDDADAGVETSLCGTVSAECDPSAPGWEKLCDADCRRTVYTACTESTEDCGGNNALCASYDAVPGSQFCASFCQDDAACPALPGFAAACNFAWCTVLCDAGTCPAGMTCSPAVEIIDFQGQSRGARDICVIAPALP